MAEFQIYVLVDGIGVRDASSDFARSSAVNFLQIRTYFSLFCKPLESGPLAKSGKVEIETALITPANEAVFRG